MKSDLDILAKLIPFSEILWKHIHIFYIYTTHKRLQKWWRYHHYLNVEVSWNVTFQFCFFFCSENDAVKKIVVIMVYGKAFFYPYFYHRYKSLIYLVTLKLWYGYGYWLHNLFLFLWHLSLPWLLFSVRFSLYNFYLEHNFDIFCVWSNFGYFVLLRFAFTTFLWNLSSLEKF